MNLSRRQLLGLLGATAATTVVGESEAKPNRSEVPQFEIYANANMRLCKFCKKPIEFVYAEGPDCIEQSKLSPMTPCPNCGMKVYYELAPMLDDMIEYIHNNPTNKVLCADEPKELMIGFVAFPDPAVLGPSDNWLEAPVSESWYIPLTPLARRKGFPTPEDRPDLWKLIAEGRRLMTSEGRRMIAEVITVQGRWTTVYPDRLFPHGRS